LAQCGHVKRKAADILGVSLKTLYNRLEVYNGRTGAGPAVESASGDPEPDLALPPGGDTRPDEDRFS
ncbi:MAG TPA: helix-turn-helix domain-containing protein, partial [Steroidobacteraceae bacterium]|nr:helix-turn-helix domain-containing protein [Steroidobacteraceae bacterium]